MSHNPPLQWRSIEGKEVRFAGIGYADHIGAREAFAVLIDGAEYFGEFRLNYYADHNTYGVEIASFGYSSMRNLGNPAPTARKAFEAAQAEPLRRAIVGLFESEGPRPTPLKNLQNFDRTVTFVPGWLRSL